MDRPIPSFYCCYLLRSSAVKRPSWYVGCTNHPQRRLKQHNGVASGGAKKTRRDTHRPWTMSLLVTGFPSNIAALQFEWAWQNIHKTRHVPREEPEEEIEDDYKPAGFFNYKTGSPRRRPQKPVNRAMSLEKNLLSLHVLLRVKSFERFPLELRFYSEEVLKLWEKMIAKASSPIRDTIKIVLCTNTPPEASSKEHNSTIDSLDVSYVPSRPYLMKSTSMSSVLESLHCEICSSSISPEDMMIVCPGDNCSTVTHATCLSQYSLDKEQEQQALLPVNAVCPGCHIEFRWVNGMRDLSLRIRGSSNAAKLLRQKHRRTNEKIVLASSASSMEASKQPLVVDTYSETEDILQEATKGQEEDEDNGAVCDLDEFESLASDVSGAPDDGPKKPVKVKKQETPSSTKSDRKRVIANSDWDDIDDEI